MPEEKPHGANPPKAADAAAIATPISPLQRSYSRRRAFDTFYLFSATLLFLAIAMQIVALAIYR